MHVPEIPTLASLGVIVVTLFDHHAASLYKTRVHDVRSNGGDATEGTEDSGPKDGIADGTEDAGAPLDSR